MKNISIISKTILTIGFLTLIPATSALAASQAHKHIELTANSAPDTPSERGLMPTAMRDALVSGAHASYTADATDDLGDMQLHVGHVLHAIDPTMEPLGPGTGYGLLKAAAMIIEQMKLASESKDASRNVKLHAKHVIMSVENAIEHSKLALIEADAILEAEEAAEAAPHAIKFAYHTKAALMGLDANGDGKVSWKKGEGGIQVADKHLGLMMNGEGLSR